MHATFQLPQLCFCNAVNRTLDCLDTTEIWILDRDMVMCIWKNPDNFDTFPEHVAVRKWESAFPHWTLLLETNIRSFRKLSHSPTTRMQETCPESDLSSFTYASPHTLKAKAHITSQCNFAPFCHSDMFDFYWHKRETEVWKAILHRVFPSPIHHWPCLNKSKFY